MRETSNVLPVQLNEAELLNFLFDFAFREGYAVAAWKLPEHATRQVILSRKVVRDEKPDMLEDLPPGFVFAPFDRRQIQVFLPADLHFTFSNGSLAEPADLNESASYNWLTEKLSDGFPPKTSYYINNTQSKTHDPDHFIHNVQKALDGIEAGHFEKVVPSRCKYVSLPAGFDLVESFIKLCTAYPNAFVSAISSAETGTWIGATPEELVRIVDKTIFKTVALAGTQQYDPGINLRKVAWTQKEIEEQALVERYIISCFKKIRLREYDEHGPKTVVAGNLIHLRSDFTVNMKETNFPQLGSTMLQLLHPTSAVCGMPLEPAWEFLKEHEDYDRSFYSGFLGPVNINNQIDIFVNLRCMQLIRDQAIVYAGAGVTIDSIPEQEWEETEMKMNTLLSIIF